MAPFDVNTTATDILAAYGSHAHGKTFLITGPSKGGLGAETAIALASAGADTLILAGRTEAKITPVIGAIKSKSPNVKVVFISLDLTSNASVRQAATLVNSKVGKIDVLINNAGIAGQKACEKTVDGVEKHFAANYLGHFLFTNLVLGKVKEGKGTVINVTSMAYTLAEVDVKDVSFADGESYNGWIAYARSKTANILFSFSLGEKLRNEVAVFAVDPGSKPIPPPALISVQQAFATTLLVALDPSLRAHAPGFVKECTITPVLPYANDANIAQDLWALSEDLVKEKF